MKPAVKQCPKCGKVKKLDTWIEPPMELVFAIVDETIGTIKELCPVCC